MSEPKTCTKCGSSSNPFRPKRRTCVPCYNIYLQDWYRQNRERAKKTNRKNHLRRNYNLSEEGFLRLVAAQKSMCAICVEPLTTRAQIDHCHTTNKVREVLCWRCNSSIGKFGEDPVLLRKAAEYLERHKCPS